MSKPRGDFSTPVLTVEFTTEMNTSFEKESSSAFCCVALLLPSSSETRRWVNFLHFGAGELTLKLDDGVAGEQGEASMRRRYNWHLSEQKEKRKGGERQRHRGEERRGEKEPSAKFLPVTAVTSYVQSADSADSWIMMMMSLNY